MYNKRPPVEWIEAEGVYTFEGLKYHTIDEILDLLYGQREWYKQESTRWRLEAHYQFGGGEHDEF